MGTFGSTFSAYINRIRGYHSSCLVPDKGIYFTNWPQDEARTPLGSYAGTFAECCSSAQLSCLWLANPVVVSNSF
jgi:hypothetical protein